MTAFPRSKRPSDLGAAGHKYGPSDLSGELSALNNIAEIWVLQVDALSEGPWFLLLIIKPLEEC